MPGNRSAGRLSAGHPPDPGAGFSDEALVAASAARDPAAMRALFDRHYRPLCRFLSRLVGRSGEIDDLVHATFIEVFRSASRFRAKSSARSWLYGIAVNVSLHHRRGETRRRAFLHALERQPTAEPTRPDLSVETKELVERVGRALSRLPHDRRAAFLLCDVEELSGFEAAQALGAPAGTVGRWLHEARTALRAALEEAST